VQTACDTYTWIDGNTYTASTNTPTYTLTNAVGCDSIVTLDLTVNYSSGSIDSQTACDTYTWMDGNTYTSSNNTATYTLTNSVGCDSIILLDLTVNYSSTGTDVQTACDTYTWIDGNTYTTSNNTATYTLTNAVGCDSIVTLDLTISYSNSGTENKVACDNYTWIDGNTYTSSNNTATYTLTNVAGCDSLVSLNLTVNYSSTGTDIQTACDTYTWIDGNTYTASTNTPTYTLTNAVGCDSLVTLNLTVNPVPVIDYTTVIDSCGLETGSITLNVTNGQPPYTYNWDTGDTTSTVNNLATNLYTVIVSDNNNCISTEQIFVDEINIDCKFHVYIPNVFSPNNDGNNDILYINGRGVEYFKFSLYNRWGELIFESYDMADGWDGTYKNKALNPGVFVYVINVTFNDGSSTTEKGNITLVK